MLIENYIKLIIMNVMMPNMDGLKATIKIREDKNIPIILLSAKSEDKKLILRSGELATKLKKSNKYLGVENSYLKIFSILLMILSASIFLETVFFIQRSFLSF